MNSLPDTFIHFKILHFVPLHENSRRRLWVGTFFHTGGLSGGHLIEKVGVSPRGPENERNGLSLRGIFDYEK